MFYNSEMLGQDDQVMENSLSSLESSFDEISGRVIVCKVDVATSIGKKLGVILNVEEDDLYS